jgi:hypothetical protein
MKILAIMLLIASTMFAAYKGTEKDPLGAEIKKIIPLTDITPEVSMAILSGMHPDVAIECQAGTALPLKYVCKLDFLTVVEEPNLSFKIEKTLYLRIVKKGRCYVSFDLATWEKPDFKLLDTRLGVSPDKSHVLIETYEEPAYELK